MLPEWAEQVALKGKWKAHLLLCISVFGHCQVWTSLLAMQDCLDMIKGETDG